jgi:hypothetical protein
MMYTNLQYIKIIELQKIIFCDKMRNLQIIKTIIEDNFWELIFLVVSSRMGTYLCLYSKQTVLISYRG